MKIEETYSFHPNFIFRLPSLPFPQYQNLDIDFLYEFSKNDFFKEAIYISSIPVYLQLEKWHSGLLIDKKKIEKLIITLSKFYSRSYSRCTPFGLFSGCGTGKWGDSNSIIIDTQSSRHTTLDSICLYSIIDLLNTSTFNFLDYYSNNSIYKIGDSIRFVEYTSNDNNKRNYKISSIKSNKYLSIILEKANQGCSYNKIVESILIDGIEIPEAEQFVAELIESQLIKSELEPAITGSNCISQIINILKVKEEFPSKKHIITNLENIYRNINLLDSNSPDKMSQYKSIVDIIKMTFASINTSSFFQVDLYLKSKKSVLEKSIQNKLFDAMNFLSEMASVNKIEAIENFKAKFVEQYGKEEVPLLSLLDNETGLGYPEKDVDGTNPLIDNISHNKKEDNQNKITWDTTTQTLHEMVVDCIKNKKKVLDLSDWKIDNNKKKAHLPDTFAISFKILKDKKIFFQSCGGGSATNLLGRFGKGNEEIKTILEDLANHEKKINSDKIVAEIVHTPENLSAANIVFRPAIREFEIPYLAKSSVSKKNQISCNDIMISVREKIILKSKKLKKEIIPKLSCAHNHYNSNLPVYKFLCDVKNQYDLVNFGFSWKDLDKIFKFLPRIEYKGVILQNATWNFQKSDVRDLLACKEEETILAIKNWLSNWNVPQQITLISGDQELYIDFNNAISIQTFIAEIRNKNTFKLTEFLFETSNLFVKDIQNNSYTNEIIALLLKNSSEFNMGLTNPLSKEKIKEFVVQRNFSIGSNWLYYKIYCGIKISDKILIEIIKPLTEKLIETKLIDEFFFIRYADPESHIRLRLKTNDPQKTGSIILIISNYLKDLSNQKVLSRISIDQYDREIERYGSNTIELSEKLFFFHSRDVLNYLASRKKNETHYEYAITCIENLLENFNFSLNEKLYLLEKLKNNFFEEHGGQKTLQVQLDTKYRTLKKITEEVFKRNQGINTANEMKSISESILLLKSTNSLLVPLEDLVCSYAHMMLNRVFNSRPRTCELVIYYSLHKYYSSIVRKISI